MQTRTASAEAEPRPNPRLPALYSLSVATVGLGTLAYSFWVAAEPLPWLAVVAFALLSFLVQRSSFHLGTSPVHSLAGVIDVAAVLALGPVAGACVAAVSGFSYLELNALHRRNFGRRDLLQLPLFDAGLKALMALGGGAIFFAIASGDGGGFHSAHTIDGQVLLALLASCLLWFCLDRIGWGVLWYLEGDRLRMRALRDYLFPQALLIELLPLPFSLVVALTFTRLGWVAFLLLALGIVAVALLAQRWAAGRSELTRRVAELSTLDDVGRSIAQAELDVDELCHLLYGHVSKHADSSIFQLGLFEGDSYAIKLWMRDNVPEAPRTFQLSPGIGLVNWLRESRQPILVRDFERDVDSLPAKPVYVSENPPRSALFVPLLAGETVVGTMSVQSFQPGAYGRSESRLLSAMANQAAFAIQKAQLYDRERKRARQLETIGQVSRQLTAFMEIESLFDRIVHLIRDNFGYYHVAIYTTDPAREEVAFRSSASAGAQDVPAPVRWGQGLVGWAADQDHHALVNDTGQDTRYRCVDALDETQSELAVPFHLDHQVVGVLDVQSDQIGAFGEDDLFILQALGDQIAVAIHEARLYEAERQQAWLSTALLQVADAMSQMPDMDAVLATLVRLTVLLAGVDRCAILLYDGVSDSYQPAQVHGLSPALRDQFQRMEFPAGTFPALDVVRLTREALVVSADRDGMLIPESMARTFQIQEMAVLPLQAQGELLGTMLVDCARRTRSLSPQMLGVLAGIANQAAMVIQSATLLAAQQEEAYVSMALLQVSEAVNRSANLDDALVAIVRVTPMLVGVTGAAILIRHPEANAYVLAQQYGLAGLSQGLSVGYDHPLVLELEAGAPVTRAIAGSSILATDSAAGPEMALGLPLAIKGDLAGLMLVGCAAGVDQPSDRMVEILRGIAGQAAIAVENDHLLREAAEQERLRHELDVARRIQASFLPERNPDTPGWDLATVWRPARQVGGDFYDLFALPAGRQAGGLGHPRTGLVVADVADKGVPAALFMALSRSLVRTMAISGRPPGEAIKRANNLILTDARSDLFVTLVYAILDSDSGCVQYVNAGHMPPLVVRAGDGSVEELPAHSLAVGVLPDVDFEELSVRVEPGDALVFYTDGVTDAEDVDLHRFGRERLSAVLAAMGSRPARETAAAIDEAISDFSIAAQYDDITLVVARRLPTS